MAHAQTPYPKSCGDLLAELHKKPEHLEFLECSPHPSDETKPLVASYRVKGVYAGMVEQTLSKSFTLNRITRTCCAWSSHESIFTWKDGRVYYLAMMTDETPIDKRSEWRKIPYFYVKFSREMEEP